MKFKIPKLLSILLVTSLLFIGCNNTQVSDKSSEDDTLNIVTSFYPIYISTLNIVKDIPNVTLTNMTKSQTGCLHDYQLTPQDLKTLENADILIINGAGMESFLDTIISQYPNLEIIDASSGLNLLEDDIHSHDDDHDADDDHDHDHDADEVFTSWGKETTHKYTEAELNAALTALGDVTLGTVLRAKGIVPCADGGEWLHFDYVPGAPEIRRGAADYTGRLCVIGSELDEERIAALFGVNEK